MAAGGTGGSMGPIDPKEIQEAVDKLQRQADTFGMNSREVQLYELRMKGATDQQLKLVEATKKMVDELTKQKAALDEHKKRQEEQKKGWDQSARGIGITMGLMANFGDVSKGSAQATGAALGKVAGLAAMIPTPFGAAASAVTGTLGAAVSMLGEDADKFRGKIIGAMGSISSGAKNARQAIQDVRIDILAEGAERATQALAGGGNWMQSAGMWGLRNLPFLAPAMNPQGMAATEMENAMRQASRMEEVMRRMRSDPILQGVQETLGTLRARRQGQDVVEQNVTGASSARAQAAMLSAGGSAEAARDVAEQYQHINTLALQIRRENETIEQAQIRATDILRGQGTLQQINASQQERRRAQATLQVAELNRQSSLQLQVQQGTLAATRAQRDTLIPVVDQSRDLVELNRLRAEGATEAVVRQRQEAMDQARLLQVQQNRAQYTNEVVNRTRFSTETFRLEMQRLRDAEMGGEMTGDVASRERGRLVRGLIDSAGPLNRLPQMFEEGSAAAVTAAYQSQQEFARADPLTALPAALDALQELQRSQLDYNRQAALALQRMADAGWDI